MTPAERERVERITNKMNLIEGEMQNASNLFKQGRKTDAARLYVACAEAMVKVKQETHDDPLFGEALQARIQDCVVKAEIC